MASFFQKAFVDNNVREVSQADLVEALEDELFLLRDMLGEDKFLQSALNYLNDWAQWISQQTGDRPLPPAGPRISIAARI